MATYQQPIGQKRLTNIAVVKYKKGGKRFEVACFKNKVISWRTKVEKDIDEVLQTHTIFANVGKGTLAKSKDLKEVFGTDDEEVICREILDKGEFQVSDREREVLAQSQFRDVASIVMEKTINSETQLPYTMGMIERLMREVHFSVDPHKSSKQQALDLMRELQKRFPIARARMELRLIVPSREKDDTLAHLRQWSAVIRSEEHAGPHFSVVCQVEPGKYRDCDELAQRLKGRLEVVSMAVQKEGDTSFDVYDREQSPERERPKGPSPDEGAVLYGDASAADVAAASVRRGSLFSDVVERHGSAGQVAAAHRDAAQPPASQAEANREPEPGAGRQPEGGGRQQKCNTCTASFGDLKEYREHFKSDWHKHNLKRKMQNLPPLSAVECLADTDIVELKNDLDQYCR